jgi:hypothetical protein
MQRNRSIGVAVRSQVHQLNNLRIGSARMSIIHQIVLGNNVPELNQECIDSWSSLRGQFELVRA